LEAPGHERYR